MDNKTKQLIEDLRQDAEWWILPNFASVAGWGKLDEIRREWGWVAEYFNASEEVESYFNLFIAEALENAS